MIFKNWMAVAATIALLSGCNPANDGQEETEAEKNAAEAPAATPEPAKEEGEPEEAVVPEEETPADPAAEPEAEAPAQPKYRLNAANWRLEPIADAPSEAVLITIDDAPDDHSVEMATTLKELEVPAIFFVNGHFLDTEEEKENLRKIHEMGFAIGNHTYTHTNLKTIGEAQQKEEILSLSQRVEEIIGEKPKFFRAPNGSNTDFSESLVEQEGMLLMNWSYGYDWEKQYMDAAALTDIMVNTEFLGNGSNLLMHDREWTAAALPGIVEGLSAKGYSFVNPDEIEGVTP
jgi:peptidoglycan/xylan/chitin deacetylase (PgdA/CDA1 family)